MTEMLDPQICKGCDYERYLDKLDDDIFQESFKRTFDHKLSEMLTQKTLVDLGLPKRKI